MHGVAPESLISPGPEAPDGVDPGSRGSPRAACRYHPDPARARERARQSPARARRSRGACGAGLRRDRQRHPSTRRRRAPPVGPSWVDWSRGQVRRRLSAHARRRRGAGSAGTAHHPRPRYRGQRGRVPDLLPPEPQERPPDHTRGSPHEPGSGARRDRHPTPGSAPVHRLADRRPRELRRPGGYCRRTRASVPGGHRGAGA